MNLQSLKINFNNHCNITKNIPDLQFWTTNIRSIIPHSAIYIIIHQYVNNSGSDMDCFLLLPNELNWTSKTNNPEFRDIYFHQSKYDSNIWILKNEYRYKTNILKQLVKNNKLFDVFV